MLSLVLSMLAALVVVIASPGTAFASTYFYSIATASASNKTWMANIPDNASLASMSIPGTHDSLALCGNSENGGDSCEPISTMYTQTQEHYGYSAETLTTQYDAGIRSIDIRVRVNKDANGLAFTIHHGIYYQYANFTDVLAKTKDFLTANPKETVLLNLKAECTGESLSCNDASGFGTDEWRRKIFDSYLDGRAYTGQGDEYDPAPAWRSLFWEPSVTGTSQASVPTLGQVRGKVVLLGFRGPNGGIYPDYGLGQLYPGNGSNEEYVQDYYNVPEISDINDKWENVRAHLRRTNGVWDSTRPGEMEQEYKPDALYMNYTSGTGTLNAPYQVAGGTAGATGVNEFLIQCLHNTTGRCPEFYPDRPSNFGGRATMQRTGIVMMDFPGGGLIDDILKVNQNMPAPPPSDFDPGTIPGPDGATLRIMPLGDSITYGVGSSTTSSYRADLWYMLKAYTDKVSYVGSQESGWVPDDDHEGHPGKRIDEVAAIADCTVVKTKPNVVTIHLGTNDMNQNFDLANAPQRLGSLIDQVLVDSPNATVVVATLIPSVKTGMQPKIDAFNAALPGIVDQRAQQGKHVLLVEMDAVSTSELADSSHPNDAGYRDMARTFFNGITTAHQRGWLQAPTSAEQDPNTCGEATPEDIGPGWRAMGVIAPGMGGAPGRIDLVNLNGDHRADYVKIFPDGSVRAALNTLGADGKIHWVDQGIIAPGVGQPGGSVRFADMDGDGLDDYLILGDKGSLWSYLNRPGADGKFHWVAEGRIFPYHHATKPVGDETGIETGWEREDVRFGDVNGDTVDDYLVVGPAGSMDAHVRTPNTYTWTKIDTFAAGTSAGPRDRMRLGDVNGDLKVDYLVVGSTGAVHAYVNHMVGMSDGNYTEHQYFANESFFPDTTVAFRDVTGDFKADYLVVQGEQVQAWESLGGNNMP